MFQADFEIGRTWDPDRGFELIFEGGGSDGTQRFVLQGSGDSHHFTANSAFERLLPYEFLKLDPYQRANSWVWRVHNWNEYWKPIIRSALISYATGHGFKLPNMEIFVRFGSKGSVFDI